MFVSIFVFAGVTDVLMTRGVCVYVYLYVYVCVRICVWSSLELRFMPGNIPPVMNRSFTSSVRDKGLCGEGET
ncbi:hypothetical protein GGR50DRAFT_647285 [Xylaria sp. CBS 124048]|nr:hypothetical protein GGR50DRAFT_647285 [Xylaria sp. CBS 124048]